MSTTTPTAAADNDFSAALAQSLAATPTDDAAPNGTSAFAAPTAAAATSGDAAAAAGTIAAAPAGAATTAAAPGNSTASKPQESDSDDSSEPADKHSAADPAASALTLLEQALAAALVPMPAAPAAPRAAAAPTSSASSAVTSATAGSGSSTAALNALLSQTLASASSSGTGATASNTTPAGGSAAPAAPTAAAGAAALTALAHLPTTVHVGLQRGAPDTSNMSLSSQVGSSAWPDELGTKLTWMAHQGIESASLQLSPEHLGPLQVNISVHDGQASVWFGAAQPDTRAALEQSLPQLRQLFASQGLTLADAGVSREPPRGQDRQSPARAGAPATAIAAVSPESPGGHASNMIGLGLLDTYA